MGGDPRTQNLPSIYAQSRKARRVVEESDWVAEERYVVDGTNAELLVNCSCGLRAMNVCWRGRRFLGRILRKQYGTLLPSRRSVEPRMRVRLPHCDAVMLNRDEMALAKSILRRARCWKVRISWPSANRLPGISSMRTHSAPTGLCGKLQHR